jgi:ABC-2 type transport system ATP-binding protein
MNSVLNINSLTKLFPGQAYPALDKIDLSIDATGEIVSISGPNGSGKTTLLKCIAGLVAPTSGKISILGVDTGSDTYKTKKSIGMSTDQERSFYWRLSGRENIRFFAGLHGISKRDVDKKLESLAEILNVTEYLDLPFSRYSTGIRQRFSIIRALIHEPELLLLDEPHRSLDEKTRKNLKNLLSKLSQKKGTTIIYTTPEKDTIETENTRRMSIDKGKIT